MSNNCLSYATIVLYLILFIFHIVWITNGLSRCDSVFKPHKSSKYSNEIWSPSPTNKHLHWIKETLNRWIINLISTWGMYHYLKLYHFLNFVSAFIMLNTLRYNNITTSKFYISIAFFSVHALLSNYPKFWINNLMKISVYKTIRHLLLKQSESSFTSLLSIRWKK